MSVLKNLKSIFIVEESKSNNPEGDAAQASSGKGTPAEGPAADTGAEAPLNIDAGTTDDKIIDALFAAIERSNLGGFDYLEFKKSVKGLEKMVDDEATRFKSAFATASTMGVTLDKLVDTAGHYMRVLDEERQKFSNAARQQTTNLVDNRKRELQDMLKAMADKKEQIDRLTKELAENEANLKKMQDGIDQAVVKIEETKQNFDVSFNYLKEQITADIEKMTNFLK